ncbi:MAG TPA: thiamine pyrophosphate-dependent enzyme, partial [Euzebya sp.]|nr:thiamine pyrophosphate-dependent enzyme [Euzebya sp.]
PVIVAGGGVRYPQAEEALLHFATGRGVPVIETVAGKGSLPWDDPHNVGPVGVTGSTSANAMAAEGAPAPWTQLARDRRREWESYRAEVTDAAYETSTGLPSYAQVIEVINGLTGPHDLAVVAAGGLPGELNKLWRSHAPGSFDCEYGFSCMGYEIAGAWGASMSGPRGEVVSFCGDGSYLMANSDVFSSVLSGHKIIVILCDNGGYSVIQRLQEFKGGAPFNNRYDEGTRRVTPFEVDYAAHAAAMGAEVETVSELSELATAFGRARRADRTSVIVIRADPYTWTGGDAWWDVGVPEVSEREEVMVARAQHEAERNHQRTGI